MHDDALKILAEIPADLHKLVSGAIKASPELSDEKVAEQIATGLNEGQRWELACRAVEILVAQKRRAHSRLIEKSFIRPAPSGRPARRTPTDRTPDPAKVSAFTSRLWALAEEESRRLLIDLTADLLDAEVPLGDGSKALTGDLTVVQREARIEMLKRNAGGTVDTAVRELALLRLQQENDDLTVREVAQRQAVA